MTLETVSPAMTMEMAQPRLVGATSDAAMTAATPKKAPCGRPGGEPGNQHAAVVGGDERGQVGDAEEQHEAQGQVLARKLRTDGGQHRCADDDAQGVGGDQVAGLRRADVESQLHFFEQAHHGEFGDTDAEAAHGQGENGESEVWVPDFGLAGSVKCRRHVPAFRSVKWGSGRGGVPG